MLGVGVVAELALVAVDISGAGSALAVGGEVAVALHRPRRIQRDGGVAEGGGVRIILSRDWNHYSSIYANVNI